MRQSLTLLIALFSVSVLYAQITIESNTLPKRGDMLEYSTFVDYQDTTSHRNSGENMVWTFNDISVTGSTIESYLDISTTDLADSFPDADLLVSLDGLDAAAKRYPDKIAVIGFTTGGFGGFGVDSAIDFSKEFTVRQTPLSFGTAYDDDVEVIFTIDAAQIPFLDSLDAEALGLPGEIDAIRVTTELSRSEEVIGWGTVNILNESREVLQVKEINNTNTAVELGVLVFGFPVWIDIGEAFGMEGFGGLETTTTYKFMSDDSQTSIVEFNEDRFMDAEGMSTLSVTGRVSGEILSDTKDISFASAGYSIFPNPSSQYFILNNFEKIAETTSIKMYDGMGRLVLQKSSYSLGERISVDGLNKGLYLLMIHDGAENVSTQVVIK